VSPSRTALPCPAPPSLPAGAPEPAPPPLFRASPSLPPCAAPRPPGQGRLRPRRLGVLQHRLQAGRVQPGGRLLPWCVHPRAASRDGAPTSPLQRRAGVPCHQLEGLWPRSSFWPLAVPSPYAQTPPASTPPLSPAPSRPLPGTSPRPASRSPLPRAPTAASPSASRPPGRTTATSASTSPVRGSRVLGQGAHGRGKRGRAPAPACPAKQAAAATHEAEPSSPCRLTRCTLPATAAARPQHADDTSSTCKDIRSLCGPSGCQFSILTQGFFSDGQTTPVACKAVDAVPIALRERNAPGAQIPTCAALASVPRPPRCAAQPCPDESLPFLPPSCHLRSHAVPRRPGRPQRHLRRLRRGFLRKGPLPHPALRPVPQRPGRAQPRLLGVHALHRQLVAQRGTHRLP
jgi:hypothetical protein